MSIKLTDTQIVMLSAAAQRDDRCLVAPRNLKGGAAQKVAAKLIDGGLAKEIKAKPGAPVWRQDEQAGQSFALKLTAAGVRAIAIDDRSASDDTRDDSGERVRVAAANSEIIRQTAAEVPAAGAPSPSAPRGGTKLARVLELLQRDCGATLEELIAATDWLPHTTRAALTGLRKRGYAVTIDRSDKERGSTYRARLGETIDIGGAGGSKRRSTDNLRYPKIEERSTRGEAASATGSVMSRGRRSGDVGEIFLSSVVAEQSRNARRDCRGPCRSRRRPASSSMAQSFGRDGSRPFAALATPEGSGLSASGGCARRPRQGDCAFYSRFARRRDRFRRQSLQAAQAEDAGRDWPQSGRAARPRVERQTGKGDGARQGLCLERPRPLAAFPKSLRPSPAQVGTVTAFSACDPAKERPTPGEASWARLSKLSRQRPNRNLMSSSTAKPRRDSVEVCP